MAMPITFARLVELTRFYQAAAVNALFGFSMYAFFVALGINIYVAQIMSHCLGVAFNYFTYSRHVFRDAGPAKMRFVAIYVVNYFIGLGSLALVARFIASPYLAGLVALVLASIINYFALKHIVFIKRIAG
ncbi:GtrA family protein [Sphingomonas sp. 28-63-12]|uniref:GtrA family protein n=1 Tax=Sphingomonas sp. 28-63-12 TaxID=1970434 RepID=UPI000BCCF349|nr:MAG: hypothetical protein B7Y47_10020 [Sphingomonas sp. 28-63-12]